MVPVYWPHGVVVHLRFFNAPELKAQVHYCVIGRPFLCRYFFTFSTSPLKPLNGIQRNLIGSRIQKSSTKFMFLGRSGKQDGRPGL